MKQFSNQENFYKRLRELGKVDAPAKSTSLDRVTLIEYARANDGSALGIIKEDDSFYIKSSNVKGENIGVENFTYIGGLENRLKYKYSSLSEATKNRNFYISNLNESLERKFNPAKTLNEEQELLSKTNADKGGIANAQSVADKSTSATISDTAKENEIAKPVTTAGIANAQSVGDKNKSDDNGSKLKQEHEASTATGSKRTDIATAQTNANSATKSSITTSPKTADIDSVVTKNSGEAKAQNVADQNKSNDKGAGIKDTAKEVKPASDAHKEKAIVVENFGEETQNPNQPKPEGMAPVASSAPAEAPVPPTAPSSSPTPNTGGDDVSLDAAANALDNLDIAPVSNGEEQNTNLPTSGNDANLGGENSPESGTKNAAIGDDAALKDAEKLVGKTGQVIRSTDLTPEMAGGFLKALLSAFEDKLPDLDIDLKRELSNTILKAGEEGETSNGTPEVSGVNTTASSSAPETSSAPSPEDSANSGSEPNDKEIEEAINAHLSEIAGEQQPENGVKPFKGYMEERGYDPSNVNEVSIMEMVSLVNGYANECDDYAAADMQTIAEYMNPEIKKGVVESGHGIFAEGVEVYSQKVKTPKSYELKEPKIVSEEFTEEEPKVDEGKKVNFAPAGESLYKKEDKKEEKKDEKKEEVSESAKKLKAIIKTKIQERLGLKKKTLTENSKSNLSKKIDIMIDEEIKKNKDFLKQYKIK